MRLASFRIRNFKSIVDTNRCSLGAGDNVLVLAGQNEAGKSAVLEALDFFRNGPSKSFANLQRRREENPQAECHFSVGPADLASLREEGVPASVCEYFENSKVVEMERVATEEGEFEIFLTDEQREAVQKLLSVPSPVAEGAGVGEAAAAPEAKEPNPPEPLTVEALEALLRERLPKFVFFDSFENLLPGVVSVADIGKYPAVLDFQKVFSTDFAKVVTKEPRAITREQQRLGQEASDNLNTYWTQRVDEDGRYNFSVKIVPAAAPAVPSIEFMIDRNDGDPLFLEQKSKGFRWFSAFNLRLRALGVEEKDLADVVLLIDEPGQGLHETAQKNAKGVLDELGKKGAQVLYSTHHPNLIGIEGPEFARLRLVSNTRQKGTRVETVAQFASRSDVAARDTLAPIITAMGIQSAGSIVSVDRRNVVVEGITDHYYLTAFGMLLKTAEKVSFLPSCGVNNVPSLVSVLLGWGLDFRAILDDDQQSGRKAYQLLKKHFFEDDDQIAQQRIYRLQGCTGIEDVFSREDFSELVLGAKPTKRGQAPPNSELAKGRKELLARTFLEKVRKGEVSRLSDDSMAKIEPVFVWLKKAIV
ncbi:MAG: AAA family ATPase [Vicinamibacteria bacterium]|nr:AAA family ATPase [Vicinamibacteria bacterium]